jgi:hypothetical protein
MSSFVTTIVVAGQLSLLSAVAQAASAPQPESASGAMASIAPVGCPAPTMIIGGTVGEPEDDILAVVTVVVDPHVQAAFGSRGARELQGLELAETGLDQPALGSKGARELQGYVVRLTQPADGARGARELQLPIFASLTQPIDQC